MDDTEKILKERIESSPEIIRGLIASNELSAGVKEIATENSLTPEQTTSLENEVLFVLIGMEFYKDFKQNIEKELGVPESTAQTISSAIEEEIFDKVIDYIPKEKEEPPQNQNDEKVYNLDSRTETVDNATENKWWETAEEPLGSVGKIKKPGPLPEIPQQSVLAPDNLPSTQENKREETVRNNTTEASTGPAGTVSSEPILKTPNIPSRPTENRAQSIIDETLSKLSKDEEEWEKRKRSLGSEDKVVKSDYSGGEDPYHEPLT